MIVELDPSLAPIPFREPEPRREPHAVFLAGFADRRVDWRTGVATQSKFLHSWGLDGAVTHRNYLEYLEHAYAHHRGVVLAPDHLWNAALCELAALVAADPEAFRALFTDAPPGAVKEEIRVEGPTGELPLAQVAAELARRVPGALAATCLAPFSTTEPAALDAHRAAFAAAASPFYSYAVFACGLPRIRIDGTADDWRDLADRAVAVARLAAACGSDAAAYLAGVGDLATRIAGQFAAADPEFLRGIFRTRRCGSGSQEEVLGWWSGTVHRDQPELRLSRNFSTHAAVVPFRDLPTAADYELHSGLFASADAGDFLVPAFGRVVVRVAAEPVVTPA